MFSLNNSLIPTHFQRVMTELSKKYPDIEVVRISKNVKLYISKSSAKLCDNFEIQGACGCCCNVDLYLMPYFVECVNNVEIKIYYHTRYYHKIGIGGFYNLETLEISTDYIRHKLLSDGIQNKLIDRIIVALKPFECSAEFGKLQNEFRSINNISSR